VSAFKTNFFARVGIDNHADLRENLCGEKKAKHESVLSPLPTFAMAANLAQLRSQVELALAGRVASPFSIPERRIEQVSTGISEIDAMIGGLPRGALSEIVGPSGSGRTSLLFSAFCARTKLAETCALVDGCDAFDPHSAESAGIDLKKLLWVRCRTIEQSFRAADFLLTAGGFGFIALDLGDTPRELVHRVPLDTWFRFRRAVEGTPTILLVLEQEPHAKTCASMVLQVEMMRSHWNSTRTTDALDLCRHPFSRLLDASEIRAEMIRSRTHQGIRIDFQEVRDSLTRNDNIPTESKRRLHGPAIFKADELFGFKRSWHP